LHPACRRRRFSQISPEFTRDDIRACLAFAAAREDHLMAVHPARSFLLDENLSDRIPARIEELFQAPVM